ncbi:HesA/MoeB/ThiF family protein [Alteromonas sp. C1M14]|uniref:HesA/MoeB/ThiF family protein n=1 Tax=Alteromonas sp. C1M14 TaxID=2841567 RepID=UPI001C0921A8|nr:HesA/MoeB/ThiF family protein [Alteromonas sp. C1M14]MBU2979953.1 HesA/MoeB/ThiF family protein [Alteromonas sp. C1M14]
MLRADEYSRYSRHLLLENMDEHRQQALKHATVAIFGVGGLGHQVGAALIGAGIGNLLLIDDDNVELSNLPRQWLFDEASIGMAKVEAAKQRLQVLHSECRIKTFKTRVIDNQLSKHLLTCSIIIDCTDNVEGRLSINRFCYQYDLPLITAAASGFVSTVMPIKPGEPHGCYACLSASVSHHTNCTDMGIYSPVVAMAGQFQAMLALNYLTDIAPVQWGQLHRFDADTLTLRTFNVGRDPACHVCRDTHGN